MVKLQCTAHPLCPNDATCTMVNYKSRVVLGYNCDHHMQQLTRAKDPDYDRMPLPETEEGLAQWYKTWKGL